MSLLNTVKALVAKAERAAEAAQVKTGAVASRQVVKTTPRAADLHVVPAGIYGGVWFREVVFTTAAGAQIARAARAQASERAFRSTSRVDARTPIVGGSDKYLPRRKGGGTSKTGRAGAVPQVLTEAPVAKVSNSVKKEGIKRVKKSVPAGMGWCLSQMVGEVAATVAAAKKVVAAAAMAFGELSRSLPVSRSVQEAKAIIAEAPTVYRYLARKARTVAASIREVVA